MTNQELDEAVARCLWTPKDGGWYRKYSYGHDWHNVLPVGSYSTDSQLAMELLEVESKTDFDVEKRNGTYYRVTLYRPSYEFIGEGMSFSIAVVRAFLKFKGVENVE